MEIDNFLLVTQLASLAFISWKSIEKAVFSIIVVLAYLQLPVVLQAPTSS